MDTRKRIMAIGLLFAMPAICSGQERAWTAELAVGYAGFVDDATKSYLLVGGTVRRAITPRVGVGAELVSMSNPDAVRDRNVMLTGEVLFDLYQTSRTRVVVPFVVGGLGMFWGRDIVRGGPFWSSDPAFTAGAGVRIRLRESISLSTEYRFGWELHHRLSASLGFHW